MRKCEFTAMITKERTIDELKKLATYDRNIEWQKKYNRTYEDPVYLEGYFHEWGTKPYLTADGTTVVATAGIVEDLAGNIHIVEPNKVKFTDRR